MAARSPGQPYVFGSRPIVSAILLLALAATTTPGSQPRDGTRAGGETPADDGAAAGRPSVQPASGTAPTFPWPVRVGADTRRFLDQKGNVYLLKAMSSWAMAQNCTDAEITRALEGLKALGFNAVMASPFGVHMHETFGDRYKNRAGQRFFADAPYASPFGPAWSSMDRIVAEATRLELTVVLSLFLSWGETGTVPDLARAGTANAYDFGKSLATRYAGSPTRLSDFYRSR